jgi:DNA-binding NarL/FixJ family response regulator
MLKARPATAQGNPEAFERVGCVPSKILIVDDSSMMRRALRRWIEQNPNWKVCAEAQNGAVAIEKVKELLPDLVILDLSMPVMNGLEAARHIKEIAPKTPMVMFTMYVNDTLTKDAQAAGIQRVVSKTESVMSQLIASISSLLHEPAA